MKRLASLNKPYKYVVTCIIMQKTGEWGYTAAVWCLARVTELTAEVLHAVVCVLTQGSLWPCLLKGSGCVVHSCCTLTHVVHSCGTLMWYTDSCGTLMWYTDSCGTLMWYTHVVHSCGTLMWYTHVVHSCGTLVQNHMAKFMCKEHSRCACKLNPLELCSFNWTICTDSMAWPYSSVCSMGQLGSPCLLCRLHVVMLSLPCT
jgi:hypothetical protein